MQLQDSTLKRALLGTLQRCGVDRHQDGVTYATLRDAWRRTGLRESDLRDAVRVLAETGLIRLREAGDSIAVCVTETGRHASGRMELSLEALQREVQDQFILLRARLRRRSTPGGMRRRRAGDSG